MEVEMFIWSELTVKMYYQHFLAWMGKKQYSDVIRILEKIKNNDSLSQQFSLYLKDPKKSTTKNFQENNISEVIKRLHEAKQNEIDIKGNSLTTQILKNLSSNNNPELFKKTAENIKDLATTDSKKLFIPKGKGVQMYITAFSEAKKEITELRNLYSEQRNLIKIAKLITDINKTNSSSQKNLPKNTTTPLLAAATTTSSTKTFNFFSKIPPVQHWASLLLHAIKTNCGKTPNDDCSPKRNSFHH